MAGVMAASKGIYSEQKNVCVWNKTNGGMDAFYRFKHELVFVFKVGPRRTSTTNVTVPSGKRR
jgi:hypothetical protein